MNYTVTTLDCLLKAIADCPDEMGVKIEPGVRFEAKTVRDLRALQHFPGGHAKLRIITPRPVYAESVVKIELPD